MTQPIDSDETQSPVIDHGSAPVPSGPVPKPMEFAAGSMPQNISSLPTPGNGRYLVGFMDQPMFLQHLQSTGVPIDPLREQALLSEFEAATAARERLGAIDLSPGSLQQIAGQAQEAWIREVIAEPVFQREGMAERHALATSDERDLQPP